jgi:hypothetical protein
MGMTASTLYAGLFFVLLSSLPLFLFPSYLFLFTYSLFLFTSHLIPHR